MKAYSLILTSTVAGSFRGRVHGDILQTLIRQFASNRQAHGDSEAMLGSQLSPDVQNPTRLE